MKQKIPDIEIFLDHCKEVLQDQYIKYEFSLISKYETWKEDKWKDGYGRKIKNWKNKINNTIPYLKPIQRPVNKVVNTLYNTNEAIRLLENEHSIKRA